MRRMTVIAVLLTVLMVAGCTSSGSPEVIAEVNGSKITQQEYEHRIKLVSGSYKIQQRSMGASEEVVIEDSVLSQIKEIAYNQLIMIKLIEQEAGARGIQLSDEDKNRHLADFKAMQENSGGPGAYEQVLQDFAITEAELKEELAIGLLRSRVENSIAAEALLTEEQAQQFYQANQDSFKEDGGMKVAHILVDSEAKAQDIIKQLQAGADFAQLAQSESICPSSSRGGDLGVVNQNTSMVPEFLNAALALSPGQITTQPVKTEFGYHVIKAIEPQAERLRPFEEAREEIMEQLRFEAVNTYLDQLYQKAEIKDLRAK